MVLLIIMWIGCSKCCTSCNVRTTILILLTNNNNYTILYEPVTDNLTPRSSYQALMSGAYSSNRKPRVRASFKSKGFNVCGSQYVFVCARKVVTFIDGLSSILCKSIVFNNWILRLLDFSQGLRLSFIDKSLACGLWLQLLVLYNLKFAYHYL